MTLGGQPVTYDYANLLPRPNLWERLRSAGVEPITVQPGDFQTSPLTREMYRGTRFEGAWDAQDLANATIALAAEPERLIFTYVPFVDYAGHVFGQGSQEFRDLMTLSASIWDMIVVGLPPGAVVVGAADHGLIEVAGIGQDRHSRPEIRRSAQAGDPRGVQLWGDDELIDDLVSLTGGSLVDPAPCSAPTSQISPAPDSGRSSCSHRPGKSSSRGFDRLLRCYHGDSQEEVVIPLLVG